MSNQKATNDKHKNCKDDLDLDEFINKFNLNSNMVLHISLTDCKSIFHYVYFSTIY